MIADVRLHVSLGDPSGIGPEALVRSLVGWDGPAPILHGHRVVLERALRLVGQAGGIDPSTLEIREPAGCDDPFAQPGLAQVRTLEQAVDAAMAGEVDALVTAPINKDSIHRAGFPFPGHTDYLAARAGTDVAMMFVGPRLRVALATVHLPLAAVPRALTRERLAGVIRLCARSLMRDFGLASPRLAVAGLNPHAGEAGLLGGEEAEVFGPAILDASAELGEPVTVTGPLPADTVFRRAVAGEFDAVVAAYHDQALVPVKLLDFEETVNLTVGLPYVRTSPAHGTAPDIAWSGRADPGSTRAALRLAVDLARNRLGIARPARPEPGLGPCTADPRGLPTS